MNYDKLYCKNYKTCTTLTGKSKNVVLLLLHAFMFHSMSNHCHLSVQIPTSALELFDIQILFQLIYKREIIVPIRNLHRRKMWKRYSSYEKEDNLDVSNISLFFFWTYFNIHGNQKCRCIKYFIIFLLDISLFTVIKNVDV